MTTVTIPVENVQKRDRFPGLGSIREVSTLRRNIAGRPLTDEIRVHFVAGGSLDFDRGTMVEVLR